MSMQDYEKARELIEEAVRMSGILSTFVGPKPEKLVNFAQERLSVKFPETYRRFLLEYGAGGIGSFEIYGIIQEDFENHDYRHLDVVWLTLKERTVSNLPNYLLPIFDLGDGELFCLDFRKKEGNEVKVVGFTPGYSSPQQSLDVVAEDFGKLFFDLVQSELNIIKGE
ncbi:MAG: SMI1/KNR4 family protein [Chloroflexota bacterium]